MLSELQQRKLTRCFRVYDIDDDGRIGPGDYERVVENVRVLHGLGDHSPGQQALREGFLHRWESLRDSADGDDDGGVDLDEWLSYWSAVISHDETYEQVMTSVVQRLLEIFDTDEDGVIGSDEYSDLFSVYGLSAELAREVFSVLDQNGDGAISHEELMEHVHAFYRGDDPDAPGNQLFGPY